GFSIWFSLRTAPFWPAPPELKKNPLVRGDFPPFIPPEFRQKPLFFRHFPRAGKNFSLKKARFPASSRMRAKKLRPVLSGIEWIIIDQKDQRWHATVLGSVSGPRTRASAASRAEYMERQTGQKDF